MFTIGDIERVQEEMNGLVPKTHKDIPGVVEAAVRSGILGYLAAVTYHDGDLLIQLRISDRLHLSSGWSSIQYTRINFDQYAPGVLLEILVWAHEEVQKLITAHRVYREGV